MAKVECPNHEGNFDCTPFCAVCEGEQEYDCSHTFLGERVMGEEYYCLDCNEEVVPSY